MGPRAQVARALDAVGGLDGPVGKRDKHSVETDLAPPPEHRLAPLFACVHVGWCARRLGGGDARAHPAARGARAPRHLAGSRHSRPPRCRAPALCDIEEADAKAPPCVQHAGKPPVPPSIISYSDRARLPRSRFWHRNRPKANVVSLHLPNGAGGNNSSRGGILVRPSAFLGLECKYHSTYGLSLTTISHGRKIDFTAVAGLCERRLGSAHWRKSKS